MEFVKKEKKTYKASLIEHSISFSANDSIRTVIERILFAEGNRLICLSDQN